jgi:murein DD-endopeptidase MepM/ murein hydrolase activator NlpD
MERSYRPYRTGSNHRQTLGASKPHKTAAQRRALRLMVCLGILIFSVLFKLILPNTFTDLYSKMNGSIDYKAAFSSIGAGLSGELSIADALSNVYVYAFKGGVGDIAEPQKVSHESQNGTVEASGSSGYKTVDTFLESQKEYEGLGIPDNVTYTFQTINIDFIKPVSGIVTSGFGYREDPSDGEIKFHYGTDISANAGTEIYAFADGTITFVGESTSYGNYLMIEHADGISTLYAHCNAISVQSGQIVSKGDEIATVGATGNATGDCLHFELQCEGVYYNPEYYLSWS